MISKEVTEIKNKNPKVRKNGDRVKRVFDKTMNKLAAGEKPVISRIMKEEGYSDSSAACVKVLRTATWQTLKEALPKNQIMQVFTDLIDEENTDKRTRLAAAVELCKLLDLYPTKGFTINGVQSRYVISGEESTNNEDSDW